MTSASKLLAPPYRATETVSSFRDYLELTKPRLSLLSVATAVVGYFSESGSWNPAIFFAMTLGAAFCAGGVAALNQWMEADTDARMARTADRPIPSGRVSTGSAFVLGWLLCLLGLAVLFAQVNGISALFALATMVTYLAVYTPSKRWSHWSTEIGAVAGALPPLIGWSAADHPTANVGWLLFGVLFFWQIPHFMAIAWCHRRDYAAVGFPVLAVRDTSGGRVAMWSLASTFAVVLCSLAFAVVSPSWGLVYLVGTVIAGLGFVIRALEFLNQEKRDVAAKRLFFASIAWLPLQLLLLVVTRHG